VIFLQSFLGQPLAAYSRINPLRLISNMADMRTLTKKSELEYAFEQSYDMLSDLD